MVLRLFVLVLMCAAFVVFECPLRRHAMIYYRSWRANRKHRLLRPRLDAGADRNEFLKSGMVWIVLFGGLLVSIVEAFLSVING